MNVAQRSSATSVHNPLPLATSSIFPSAPNAKPSFPAPPIRYTTLTTQPPNHLTTEPPNHPNPRVHPSSFILHPSAFPQLWYNAATVSRALDLPFAARPFYGLAAFFIHCRMAGLKEMGTWKSNCT